MPSKVHCHKSSLHNFADAKGCLYNAHNGIYIGKNNIWSYNVGLVSANHDRSDFSKDTKHPPIRIGDNCWIGMNAVILPGVELGNNTIVGAGAVVTKSFPEGHVVLAGVPAKAIKKVGPLNRSR